MWDENLHDDNDENWYDDHDENLHNDYDQDRDHDGGYHDKGHHQNDNSNEAFKQLFLTQVHVWLLNLWKAVNNLEYLIFVDLNFKLSNF